MATIRFITQRIKKGKTAAASLKEYLDYGKNPEKTDGGRLISSYMCDPQTADSEFMLTKAQYGAITGREQNRNKEILCYQIRQSFMPGEVTPEQANTIGYELAMRFTKGKYAFIVCTHIDRDHVHSHVYYNSTALDCKHKFRNFIGSARAVRRLSDRICLENNLSVVKNPKLKSKGKFQHYGQWLGDDRPLSYKEQLKAAIDSCLTAHPKSMEDFLSAMTEAGYIHKYVRGGALSLRAPEQERFTRLRASTLGEGYGYEDILAIIEGRAALPAGRAVAPQTSPRKINLIIDIQDKLKNGKGPAYERWAKVYNLKMMAAALQYLQEHKLLAYEDLAVKADSAVDRFHELAGQIQKTEAAITTNTELKTAVVDYAKTRPVFEEYKAAKYSKKYLAEHEDDIILHRSARAAFGRLLSGGRLPKMEALKTEYQKLTAEKKTLYSQYRTAQKEMREVVAVKSNVDYLLGITGGERSREAER